MKISLIVGEEQLAKATGSIWWIRMGAVTGLLAIAFQSTVEFSLQMPGNAALFAVIAGLGHSRRQADVIESTLPPFSSESHGKSRSICA